MMGRPEWFTYRIFGWGIRPKTWQGWVYGAVVALVLGFGFAIGMNAPGFRWIPMALLGLFIIDVIHIMTQLHKTSDERENYHQLIIERNCSFAAIAALAGVALYQYFENIEAAKAGAMTIDLSILVVLGVMLAVKVASTIYVKMRM